MDDMQRLSKILIEYETIDREQFQQLLAGEPPSRRSSRTHEKHAPPATDEEPREAALQAAHDRPAAARHALPEQRRPTRLRAPSRPARP